MICAVSAIGLFFKLFFFTGEADPGGGGRHGTQEGEQVKTQKKSKKKTIQFLIFLIRRMELQLAAERRRLAAQAMAAGGSGKKR